MANTNKNIFDTQVDFELCHWELKFDNQILKYMPNVVCQQNGYKRRYFT